MCTALPAQLPYRAVQVAYPPDCTTNLAKVENGLDCSIPATEQYASRLCCSNCSQLSPSLLAHITGSKLRMLHNRITPWMIPSGASSDALALLGCIASSVMSAILRVHHRRKVENLFRRFPGYVGEIGNHAASHRQGVTETDELDLQADQDGPYRGTRKSCSK